MVTLEQHADSLSRYTHFTGQEIFESILRNEHIIDDDSLLCYSIGHTCNGNYMMILWEDGDGEKMWQWIQDISKKYQCKKIYFVSQRWRPLCRKYKFRPIGVLCEREGFV